LLKNALGDGEEAIIFLGQCYSGGYADSKLSDNYYITCEGYDSSASSLRFKLVALDGIAPSENIVIHIYVPNPDLDALTIPVSNTIYTTKILLNGTDSTVRRWEELDDGSWRYDYTISDLVLTEDCAFFVNLSDDSIENISDFNHIYSVNYTVNEKTGATTFTFLASEHIETNIGLDLFAVIDPTGQSGLNQDTVVLSVPNNNTNYEIVDGKYTFYESTYEGSFSDDISGAFYPKERIVIGYRANQDLSDDANASEVLREDYYNAIQSIDYDEENGAFTLTINTEMYAGSLLPAGLRIILIQLNKLANIYPITIKKDNWKTTSLTAEKEVCANQVTEYKRYIYGEATPQLKTFTELNISKPQIIYNIKDSKQFALITEERTTDALSMLFYAGPNNIPTTDLEVMVIDPY